MDKNVIESVKTLVGFFRNELYKIQVGAPLILRWNSDVTPTSLQEAMALMVGVPIVLIVAQEGCQMTNVSSIREFLVNSGIDGNQFRVVVIPSGNFINKDMWLLVSSKGEVFFNKGA